MMRRPKKSTDSRRSGRYARGSGSARAGQCRPIWCRWRPDWRWGHPCSSRRNGEYTCCAFCSALTPSRCTRWSTGYQPPKRRPRATVALSTAAPPPTWSECETSCEGSRSCSLHSFRLPMYRTSCVRSSTLRDRLIALRYSWIANRGPTHFTRWSKHETNVGLFNIHVHDVCSKFASCLLHRVNGVGL